MQGDIKKSLWDLPTALNGISQFEYRFAKLKDVLVKATSANDIRDAMKATNMMTAFGPIKFEDKEGYTNQNFMDTLVLQVINGQFETIWPQKYASKKYVFPIPRWRDRK